MSCTPLVMSITLVLATTSTLSLYHIGVVDHYGDPHHPVVHHLGIVDCPKITYHHGVFLVYGVITTLVLLTTSALRDGLPKKVETAKRNCTALSRQVLCRPCAGSCRPRVPLLSSLDVVDQFGDSSGLSPSYAS